MELSSMWMQLHWQCWMQNCSTVMPFTTISQLNQTLRRFWLRHRTCRITMIRIDKLTLKQITNHMRQISLLKITPFWQRVVASRRIRSPSSANDARRWKRVQVVPVNQDVTFTATVEADKVNNIAPAMGGRIRKIFVEVGTHAPRTSACSYGCCNLYPTTDTGSHLRRDYERYKELLKLGYFPTTFRLSQDATRSRWNCLGQLRREHYSNQPG